MAQRGKRTPSKKERREAEEWKKDQEEQEREKHVTLRVLQHLYGFSSEEAGQYFELVKSEPEFELNKSLLHAFGRFDKGYRRTLHDLEKAAEDYEKWVEDTKASPLVKKVLDTRLDYDAIEEAYRALEAPDASPDDMWEFGSYYDVEYITAFFYHKIDRFEDQDLSHLRELADHFRALFDEAGPEVTARYAADLLEECEDAARQLEIEFVSRMLIRSKHSSLVLQREPELTRALMERMGKARDSYLALKGKYGLDILGSLPPDGMTRPALAKRAGERISGLERENADLRTALDLLRAAEKDDRWELFDTIVHCPSVTDLYKTLRKAEVSAGEYGRFLLEESDLRWAHSDRALLDTVSDIAAQPSQVKAAAFILRYGASLLSDAHAPALIEIASHYSLADIILRDYTATQQAGEPNRAAAVLAIGKYRPSAGALKSLRGKLRALSEEELTWVHDAGLPGHIIKRLERSHKEVPVTLSVPPPREKTDWFASMRASLDARGVPPQTKELVNRAYERLRSSCLRRLRNIWITQPDTLEAFCEDVLELEDAEAYQLLLRDHELFAAYKEGLQSDGGFRAQLRTAASAASSNRYRDLSHLLGKTDVEYQEPIERVPDAEELEPSRRYHRIIIWGGQYKREAKEKIKAALGMPIEVFDIFNRRKDIQGIGSDDVVICVTTAVSHSVYSSLKRYCREHGIGFYHFNRAGQNPLIEFLQEKFSLTG